MEKVMRCKFQLHSAEKFPSGNYQPQASGSSIATGTAVKVRLGAVWHGSTEKQQASENAIFGAATPQGEFTATIMNAQVAERLLALVGREFYIDFALVPIDEAAAKQ